MDSVVLEQQRMASDGRRFLKAKYHGYKDKDLLVVGVVIKNWMGLGWRMRVSRSIDARALGA